MISIGNNNIKHKTAAALGIFDGVHMGHREILNAAKSFEAQGLSFAVFTFQTSSVKKKHGKPYEYIYTETQKNHILENLGAEYIYSPRAEELMGMTGEEFAAKILRDKMNAEAVVCGENFRFGKGAACGVSELVSLGEKYGFTVKICKLLERDGEKVSSDRIREYLRSGEISKANDLLGSRYFIKSKVVTGNRLGRTINFPTANQLFEERQVVPLNGVYASCCRIGGREYSAVTNTGVKPTVEQNISPLAETYIMDFSGDLYGKTVKVEFMDFLRAERKFPSLDELKKQIETDSEKAKAIYFEK
ncbi:MAG: bifunctional riboflavin kinase/FAD synthetase [Porcipelethomonas sp.]